MSWVAEYDYRRRKSRCLGVLQLYGYQRAEGC